MTVVGTSCDICVPLLFLGDVGDARDVSVVGDVCIGGTPSTTSASDGWVSAGRSSRVSSIDNGTVRVVRGLMAGGVFLVVNGVLAIVLREFDVGSGLAGGIEIVGGLVAAFAYWRWSDPKRRGQPQAHEDGL